MVYLRNICKWEAGSGGGGTYFKIKNGDQPIFFKFLTRNKFALIHVSIIRMDNKIKGNANIFQQYLLCLVV